MYERLPSQTRPGDSADEADAWFASEHGVLEPAGQKDHPARATRGTSKSRTARQDRAGMFLESGAMSSGHGVEREEVRTVRVNSKSTYKEIR